MALTKCPECGNEISDKAMQCPICGYPMAIKAVQQQAVNQIISTKQEVLYDQKLRIEHRFRIVGIIFITCFVFGLFMPVYTSRLGSLSIFDMMKDMGNMTEEAKVWVYLLYICVGFLPILSGFVFFIVKRYQNAFGFNVYATIASVYLFAGAFMYKNSLYRPAFGTFFILFSAIGITICCFNLKKTS